MKLLSKIKEIVNNHQKEIKIRQIEGWLKDHHIKNFIINDDLTVNVNQSLDLTLKRKETVLPIQFGTIKGDFSCVFSGLTSLKGFPQIVWGNFNCQGNKLTSLEYGPQHVGGSYDCSINQLTSLKYCPKIVLKTFACEENQLTSLEFCPEEVGGIFFAFTNNITNLKFAPKIVMGNMHLENNPLETLAKFKTNLKGVLELSSNGFESLGEVHWDIISKKEISIVKIQPEVIKKLQDSEELYEKLSESLTNTSVEKIKSKKI